MEKKHLFLNSSRKSLRDDSHAANLDHKPISEPIFVAREMKYPELMDGVDGQL